jgi:regulator of protease activity HflC (stomatin/prohibitin superfamily)
MKSKLVLIASSISLILFFSVAGCNRIDAGHVGIKVNLYGSSKGVADITEVTGMVWYNRFTTAVYEVPTFVQNAVYTKDEVKGSEDNEEFRVTTKDGMIARFDISMNYLTPGENVVKIFKRYRKPVKELEKGVIRTFLREGFNKAASKYTAENLYEKRAEFESEAYTVVKNLLEKEGFMVEQIVILNEIRLPDDVTSRINDKVKAAQITKQKQEEVKQEQAEAEKRIAKTEGLSTSKIIQARADSAAMIIQANAQSISYKLKNRELTTLLLQQQYLEKWNGQYGTGNVFGSSPLLYKNVGQ